MNFRALLIVLSFTAFAKAQTEITLWPHGAPDQIKVTGPEYDMSKKAGAKSVDAESGEATSGHNAILTNVTDPKIYVYLPTKVKNNGAAALAFPGGGYHFLNMDRAGTEPCAWANAQGMVCFLVKYRVPDVGQYPESRAPLDDAQQAMRIVRSRAAEWGVDPKRIGIMGFSAGAHLAITLSTHADDKHVESTSSAKDIPMDGSKPFDARANWALVCWPAYVGIKPDEVKLNPIYTPNQNTPMTFLTQAENDPMFHNNAILYFRALMDAKVPAELHYYATGGHAFGMHPDKFSQAHWTDLAANWLMFNKIIPAAMPAPTY